ncbi:MAG: 2-hydroxychromene-2-carboxylate isomerase/DsbA-like thioredoxin domain, partial [uncultured Gemmatimonadetes bacterium]
EGRDLFGRGVPLVLHRQAALRAGAGGVSRGRRGAGRLPAVPAEPRRPRHRVSAAAVPGPAVRAAGRADGAARDGHGARRGHRHGLRFRTVREYAGRAPAAPPGGARIRRLRAAGAQGTAAGGALRPGRRRRRPGRAGKAGRRRGDGRRAGAGLPGGGRGPAGGEGRDRAGAAPGDHRRAHVRHRRPLRRAGRPARLGVPAGAGAGGRRGEGARCGCRRRALRRRELRGL